MSILLGASMIWLAVAIGGALGAMGRFGASTYLFPVMENKFPLGTLLINMLGSALMGVCYVLIVEKGVLSPEWRGWLMAGFLGAFTTFSTFALESLSLWQSGHHAVAMLYVTLSVVGCLLAVAMAVSLTMKLV